MWINKKEKGKSVFPLPSDIQPFNFVHLYGWIKGLKTYDFGNVVPEGDRRSSYISLRPFTLRIKKESPESTTGEINTTLWNGQRRQWGSTERGRVYGLLVTFLVSQQHVHTHTYTAVGVPFSLSLISLVSSSLSLSYLYKWSTMRINKCSVNSNSHGNWFIKEGTQRRGESGLERHINITTIIMCIPFLKHPPPFNHLN